MRGAGSLTDSYCTPVWLTSRLPLVHCDPCSNERSTVRALARYILELGQDGLALPWAPSVFLNWPYSDPLPWVEKLIAEIDAARTYYAIILPKHDHSTSWWGRLTHELPRFGAHGPYVFDQWQFNERLQFDIPPELYAKLKAAHEAKVARGVAKGPYRPSNNFCSTLLHWRPASMPALELADVATQWRQAA